MKTYNLKPNGKKLKSNMILYIQEFNLLNRETTKKFG